MKKKNLWKVVVVILLVVAVGLLVLYQPEEQAVTIGAVLPLTGDFAALGNWFKLGFQLAEYQINARPEGVRVKILFEDSRSDINAAISAYRKLVDVNKVKIVTTTTSPACLALKPLAVSDNVLFFANAAHPKITSDDAPLVLRHSSTITQEGALIAGFVENELKPTSRSVSIVYLNNEFGLGFKEFLVAALSDEVSGFESYEGNQTDFKNLVTKVISDKPRHVITVGFTKNLGLLIKTLRERGYKGTLVANFGFTTPGVVDLAGSSANGVYYADYGYSMDSEPLRTLSVIAQERFKSDLSPVGILAYDVVNVVAQAVEQSASTDPTALSVFIRQQQVFDIDGIRLEVTPNGDILPPLKMKRYE